MEFLERKQNLLVVLCLVILLGLGLRIYSGLQKSYFFHDGIFTLELINGPEWAKERTNENNYNRVISGRVFLDDMTMSEEEKFDYSFNKVLKYADVHPPFYYWVLHPFQALIADGEVSWWPGLILNFLCYIASSILIFKIVRFFVREKFFSLFPVAFFSCSPAMISSDMLLRMYSLFGMLSLAFIYVSFLFFIGRRSRVLIVSIFLSCTLGALTHHYFIVLAFFVFLLLAIGYIANKRYSDLVDYIKILSVSALCYLITWHVVFEQVFSSKLSNTIFESFGKKSNFIEMLAMTNNYLFSGLLLQFLCFFVLAYLWAKKDGSKLYFYGYRGYLFASLFISAISFYTIVFLTQPFSILNGSYRYFYVPSVLMICFLGVFLSKILVGIQTSYIKKISISLLVFIFFAVNFDIGNVSYLYRDNAKEGDLLYDFKNDDYPVIIKLRDEWKSTIFDESQKDWIIVNLMPYLHNKSKVYIINDKDLNENKFSKILSELDILENDDFYVITSNQPKFLSILEDVIGKASSEKVIRYNKVLKYKL
ncbi:hypothetical protein [Marinomonas ostreistagni]|uniref:Glycosyltransferase RgtA/B/C/D-like domain-containing protein n=1 Tax=Marinomonas ostreistagni TaxID=359209 RepID=A0ABS0ZBD1_9GAMM|nr:hypothetical protein [Marinomonas ostreistagni]MBJ7550266.1 hypothetical protein [Marinomonas ostreistagni]